MSKIVIKIILLFCLTNFELLSSNEIKSEGTKVELIGAANLEKQTSGNDPAPFYGIIGTKFYEQKKWSVKLVFNIATNIDTIESNNNRVFGNALYMNGVSNTSTAPFQFDIIIEPRFSNGIPFSTFLSGIGGNFNMFYRKTFWKYLDNNSSINLNANSFSMDFSGFFPIVSGVFKEEYMKIIFTLGYTFRALMTEKEDKSNFIKIINDSKFFYNGLNVGISLKYGSLFTGLNIPLFFDGEEIPGFSSPQVLINFGFASKIL